MNEWVNGWMDSSSVPAMKYKTQINTKRHKNVYWVVQIYINVGKSRLKSKLLKKIYYSLASLSKSGTLLGSRHKSQENPERLYRERFQLMLCFSGSWLLPLWAPALLCTAAGPHDPYQNVQGEHPKSYPNILVYTNFQAPSPAKNISLGIPL